MTACPNKPSSFKQLLSWEVQGTQYMPSLCLSTVLPHPFLLPVSVRSASVQISIYKPLGLSIKHQETFNLFIRHDAFKYICLYFIACYCREDKFTPVLNVQLLHTLHFLWILYGDHPRSRDHLVQQLLNTSRLTHFLMIIYLVIIHQ